MYQICGSFDDVSLPGHSGKLCGDAATYKRRREGKLAWRRWGAGDNHLRKAICAGTEISRGIRIFGRDNGVGLTKAGRQHREIGQAAGNRNRAAKFVGAIAFELNQAGRR